ncbi:MAG TPA: aspartate-semialdehyde dehydrogenase [Candidatus Altiarchaeales archaeon]|nr:aspartate-semialdehyde dehydrogenase [Candidatus Altiarchaeales archaeon]
MDKLKVGVIGATGMVGQRFIQGLVGHPYFELTALAASERSVGKKYSEAAKWYIEGDIPESVADEKVVDANAKIVDEFGLDLVFSATPSSIAKELEASFAKKIPVYSNTSTYRMVEDVPLVVGDVNPDHMKIIEEQRRNRGWNGGIITNPNCSTIGIVVPMKPIFDELGIEWMHVATYQALSGAGYDGVPSMAITDNAIPYIGGEELKVETEPLKILGEIKKPLEFPITASCVRIPVLNGHLETVTLGLGRDFEVDEIKHLLAGYTARAQELKLPTAPNPPIIVREEPDRPQPRLDRMAGNGMAVSVGRIERKREKILRFFALSHNTIRGAAGASILNAEIALKDGLL